MAASYTEADIKSLDWREHIRLRPGMYIGKLGDGSSPDDGIYILLKEVLDNAIDEYVMGHGKEVHINIDDEGRVEVRDFEFGEGVVVHEMKRSRKDAEENGTRVAFDVDRGVFPKKVKFRDVHVEKMCRYYSYLNPGFTLVFNGKKYKSKNGLLDLLNEEMQDEPIYEPVCLSGSDLDIAFVHTSGGEEYYSFVNGQHTTQGGTHLAAFRESLVKVLRDFFKKNYDPSDIRSGIEAAISIRVEEPVFESQTKTKLGSTHISPNGETVRTFVLNFLKEHLDNFLHRNPKTAEAIQKRIIAAERERKELGGVKKLAKERARQTKVHNKKLRDCRTHFNSKGKRRLESTIFLTEGDSASGSITKSRDAETQAVFSLRGKPLNTYGLTRKVVYENEEFALLQAALGIEVSIDDLRYNKVVIATDADVDGMHIRLLLLTFFLQFFPELIRDGHLQILQTPLYRVRNKKETFYCYTEEERVIAVEKCGKNPEITRFKGLGEISPHEFKFMIGPEMRLDPVNMEEGKTLRELLAFYMGKNTPDRQGFIIENLRSEVDSAAV